MELLEIVVQGVKGFPQMTRVAITPACTVLHPMSGHEQVLTAAVVGLLYPPEAGGSDPLPRLVDPNADASRVGVLLRGRDGQNYRILRDLKVGKWSLLKEAKGGFSPITSSPAEIAQAMTATLGFPQQDVYRDVFVTRFTDLPSQRQDAPPPLPPDASGPMAIQSMTGAPRSEFADLTDDDKRDRLNRIEEALTHNEGIRDIEKELDGVQSELYGLDDELSFIDELRGRVTEAEKNLAEHAQLEGMSADLPRRVELHQRAADALKRDLQRIEQETIKTERQIAADISEAGNVTALVNAALRDKFIAGGTAGGVLAIGVGLMGAAGFPALRWFALLDIPAFAVALVGAFRFIGEAEFTGRAKSRLKRLKEDEEGKKSAYTKEDEELRATFAKFGFGVEEFLRVEDLLNKRTAAAAKLADANQEMRRVLSDPAFAEKSKRRDALRKQVDQGESDLYSTGGYMGDANKLRADAEDLRALLEGRTPPSVADAPQQAGGGDQQQMQQMMQQMQQMMGQGGPTNVWDPSTTLVRHATDLLMTSVDQVCETLQPRLTQYLAGLTDRRYGQAMFGPAGELTLVETASGRSVPFAQLSPGDRDVAYLALKLTICEASVRRGRVPMILERALETFPPNKDDMIVRMLQYLAGLTQVVCMTKKPSLVPAGQQVTLS